MSLVTLLMLIQCSVNGRIYLAIETGRYGDTSKVFSIHSQRSTSLLSTQQTLSMGYMGNNEGVFVPSRAMT